MDITKCHTTCVERGASLEKVISHTEDTYVAVLSAKPRRLLLKLTTFGDVFKEVRMMDDARVVVPVPEVYEYGAEADVRFVLMQYIEDSVTLSQYEGELTGPLWAELERVILAIRSVTKDYSLGDTGDHYLKVCRFGMTGYSSATEFMRGRLDGLGLEGYSLPNLDESRLVLSHCDLWPCNVMVSEDGARVTAIIDWQTAGYYPDFYERSIYVFRCKLESLRGIPCIETWIRIFETPKTGVIDCVEDEI